MIPKCPLRPIKVEIMKDVRDNEVPWNDINAYYKEISIADFSECLRKDCAWFCEIDNSCSINTLSNAGFYYEQRI